MFPSCAFLGKFLWVVLRCMTHITVCHRASIFSFSGVGGGGGRVLGRIEVYDPYHWASSFLHLQFPGEVSVTCIKLYGQQEEFYLSLISAFAIQSASSSLYSERICGRLVP